MAGALIGEAGALLLGEERVPNQVSPWTCSSVCAVLLKSRSGGGDPSAALRVLQVGRECRA